MRFAVLVVDVSPSFINWKLTLRLEPWSHSRETKIVKVRDIVYLKLTNVFNKISVEWRKFLNQNTIQKVLYQMKFNNFELTEKYVSVFTRYKEIEKIMKTEGACK